MFVIFLNCLLDGGAPTARYTSSIYKLDKDPRDGTVPTSLLLSREIHCSFDALASEAGMNPSILLFDMENLSRYSNE